MRKRRVDRVLNLKKGTEEIFIMHSISKTTVFFLQDAHIVSLRYQ